MSLEKQLEELQRQVQELRDIEEIKKLKGKYLRCLDSKLWDEIKTCFTEDVTTSYANGKLSFKGVDEVTNFFSENMPATQITMHQCHTPEITLTSETTADAIWYLGDYLIVQDYNLGIRGAAFYKSKYEKVDGEWLIKHIGYERVFEERWSKDSPEKAEITECMHTIKK